MRCRESLMQIEMHHVDAEVARPRDPDQRIHIRAIHVNQRALGVQELRDASNVLFENAERVRIRDHQRRDVVIHRACERFQIHHAALVRLDVFHRISGHARSRRIGAVRRIRDQQPLAGDFLGIQAKREP